MSQLPPTPPLPGTEYKGGVRNNTDKGAKAREGGGSLNVEDRG